MTDPLTPGKAIAVDIELWPTSVTLRPGEGQRVVISGKGPVLLITPPRT